MPPKTTRERIASMTFASIYPLYLNKVEKKGRTEDELARGKAMEKILRS